MTQWVFLVGGKGSRLGSLTAAVPKPLLPVGGRPFLNILIERAVRLGASEILLLAAHLSDRMVADYDGSSCQGVPIRCLVEPTPLGTGGAIAAASAVLQERWVLANGDTLFDMDPAHLAPLKDDWAITMALRQVSDTGRSGIVAVDNGYVRSFAARGDGGPGVINAGTYVMRRAVLDSIPRGRPCSLENEILPHLAERGLVRGIVLDGYFIDIGIPEDYARAQTEIPLLLHRG